MRLLILYGLYAVPRILNPEEFTVEEAHFGPSEGLPSVAGRRKLYKGREKFPAYPLLAYLLLYSRGSVGLRPSPDQLGDLGLQERSAGGLRMELDDADDDAVQ
jgi:hypothetical protein